MTVFKRVAGITTRKMLLAAALASLTALVSATILCFIRFHQPEMSECVRQIGKFKE